MAVLLQELPEDNRYYACAPILFYENTQHILLKFKNNPSLV